MSGYIFENRIGEYVCILNIPDCEAKDQEGYKSEENLYTLVSEIKESILK